MHCDSGLTVRCSLAVIMKHDPVCMPSWRAVTYLSLKKIIHGLSWRWSSFSSRRTIPSAVPTSLNWKFRNIMKRRLRNLYIKNHIALKHKQTLGAVKDEFTQTMVSSTQNDHFTSNHSTVILKVLLKSQELHPELQSSSNAFSLPYDGDVCTPLLGGYFRVSNLHCFLKKFKKIW